MSWPDSIWKRPPDSVPPGIREITVLAVSGGYLVFTTLIMSADNPLWHWMRSADPDSIPGGALARSAALPYVARVHAKMLALGLPQAQIDDKLTFLSAAFVLLIGAYALALAIAGIAYLLQGVRTDPAVARLSKETGANAVAGNIMAFLMLSGGLVFMFWLAVEGFGELAPVKYGGRYVDHIIQNNVGIWRSIVLMSLSLAAATIALRIVLVYVAIALSGVGARNTRR